MFKSKPKQPTLEEDMATLGMATPADNSAPFRALDHIKLTKPVTKAIELWQALNQIQQSIENISRINRGLPANKSAKYNQKVVDLTVKKFNANQVFQRAYQKLNNPAKIEFALRTNELTKLKR